MSTAFEQQRGATPRFIAITAAFWALQVAIGAAAIWPIYADPAFIVLVVVATVVAGALAIVLRRRPWPVVVGATAAAYLVFGVPLAVPTALAGLFTGAGIGDLAGGWVDLVAGTVLSWKQLATIATIPVGTYQTLLVPALIAVLATGVAAVSAGIRSSRAWIVVVPLALALHLFAVGFGAPEVASDGLLARLTAQSSRQATLGLLAFFAALAYVLWHVRSERRAALGRAQHVAGIRQSGAGRGALARRLGLAGGTLVVGVVIASLLAPTVTAGSPRQVLRSAIDPERDRVLAESPLTDYRASFAPGAYEEPLFRIDGDALDGDRIRLAVLSAYDGQQYRAVDEGAAADAFVRVPSSLTPPETGPTGTVTVTVEGYRGAWLPTVADLERVVFTGADATDRQDAFFYDQELQAGLVTRPLTTGDTFQLTATVPTDATPELGAPGTSSLDPDELPDSLRDWVAGQADQSLATLLAHLRARGYLSHAIFAPAAGTDGDPTWLDDLGGATFAASRAGHSIDRIDALFTQLLEKQRQSPAATDDADLVAAVGDDEQFAVAGALLAQYLGYSARVVLGFALSGVDRGADDIPACTDECSGRNLTAWIEVRGASGDWVTLDTTPQHTAPLNPVQTSEQPPKNGTTVLPDSAEREQATASDPSGSDDANRTPTDDGVDLAWLATILKVTGLVLLALAVVIAPFATILLAKAQRRRRRRAAEAAEDRIVGGWDEYVDAAIDHGLPAPERRTRSQLATVYATPNAAALATMADRAVFAPVDPADADAERFWAILEGERAALERDWSAWRRWRAALALRSFTRHVRGIRAPALPLVRARAAGAGRGGRPVAAPDLPGTSSRAAGARSARALAARRSVASRPAPEAAAAPPPTASAPAPPASPTLSQPPAEETPS